MILACYPIKIIEETPIINQDYGYKQIKDQNRVINIKKETII